MRVLLKTRLVLILAIASVSGGQGQQRYRIEVPYQLERGHLMVTADVDGIEGKYLFDTGAPTVVTHSRFTKGHAGNLTTTGVRDAHGQNSNMKVAAYDSFKIGGYEVKGIRAIVMDEGNILEMLGVDGIIGYDLFPQGVVRMDSKNKIITISSDISGFGIDPRSAIPMINGGQGHIYFDVNLGRGVKERVMFDTGSPAFFEFEQGGYEKAAGQPILEVLATGYGANSSGAAGYERESERTRLKINDLRVGLGKFSNVTTYTMTGPSSRIGSKILDYGFVTIDYHNRIFYFEPFDRAPVDMYRPAWDIEVVVVGQQLQVGMIWDGADPIAEVGDQVIEIDGANYENVDPVKALEGGLLSVEVDQASLVIRKKDGSVHSITIHKN